ncbi:hypothetical protein HRbin36_01789 [bacterium HR36]|nr:hypothetical protein HRbin36_01789 [bacterium HR36]
MSGASQNPEWVKTWPQVQNKGTETSPEKPTGGPQGSAKPGSGPPAGEAGGSSGPPIRVREPVPPGTAGTTASKTEYVAQVTYFRKGFRERCYPLTVQLTTAKSSQAAPLPEGAVEVRPSLPGALVWPQKQTLGGDQRVARFWVLPLATGKLPEAHVTISGGSNGPQRIALPMKVKKGRGLLFWLCVWLTVLVPVGLFVLRSLPYDQVIAHYTAMRPSPVTGEETHVPYRGRAAIEAWLKDRVNEAEAVPAGDRSVRQWLMWLLGRTGSWLPDLYDGYEILLQETMLAEPAAFAVMLFITLAVGWWTGARRKMLKSKPFLLATP